MCDPIEPTPDELELEHQLMTILLLNEKIFEEVEKESPDWNDVREWMEQRGNEIETLLKLDRPEALRSSTEALFDRFEAEHRKMNRLLRESLDHQRGELRQASRRAEAEKGYRLSRDPKNPYH